MGDIKVKALGGLPLNLDKVLFDFLMGTKENFDIISGYKGSDLTKMVTFADLEESDVNKATQRVNVADIDNPDPELSSKKGTYSGRLLVAYEKGTTYKYTIYAWSSVIEGSDSPYIVPGKGGTWTALSGEHTKSDPTFSELSANRLVYGNASKKLSSLLDLTDFIAGTTNQLTVTDDTDGTVTLSLPQNVHSGATPNFTGITLSGLTSSRIVSTDASKNLESLPPESNISDAVAVTVIQAEAGSDNIDMSALNAKLTTLTTEINAIKDKVNLILSVLENTNLMSGT